jgi:N6-adenosine-specific RNA methylase IME4
MRYRTIVADPPWPMGPAHGKFRAGASRRGNWGDHIAATDLPYASMNLPLIARLPVDDLADQDAHLYIWAVNKFLESAYSIARAWGFRPAQVLTWCKAPMGLGLGEAFTPTTEFVLVAKRGKLSHTGKVDSSWWQWKRAEHSAKPDAFLDMVERVSPGPYLELFARRARFGWDYWGDESLGTAEMPEAVNG